jgi:hypothetical protein
MKKKFEVKVQREASKWYKSNCEEIYLDSYFIEGGAYFDIGVCELWPVLNQVNYSKVEGGHLINREESIKADGLNWAMDGSLLYTLFTNIFKGEKAEDIKYGPMNLSADMKNSNLLTNIRICDARSRGAGPFDYECMRRGGGILFLVSHTRGPGLISIRSDVDFKDYYSSKIEQYLVSRIPSIEEHLAMDRQNRVQFIKKMLGKKYTGENCDESDEPEISRPTC